MSLKPLRLFVQILVFGLLLGVSSTAYADMISITAVSFSNFQITPATGTVQFTPTGATAVAVAINNQGQSGPVMSNTLPVAQANASILFASSSSLANATNFTAEANSSVSLTGCTCVAAGAAQGILSGTFVISGGEGLVNVNISGLFTMAQTVMADQFGFSESTIIRVVSIDGVPILDVTTRVGAGRNSSDTQTAMQQLSQAVTLQFNVPHTVTVHIHAGSLAGSEVPEPATAVLLVSGLGFMASYVRNRKKTNTTP